jgi:hypothetical protein
MKKCFAPQLLLVLLLSCAYVFGQEETPKYNFNIGGGFGVPMGHTSDFINTGGNFVVGGGANMGHMIGFNGEFMWQDLPPKSSVIALTGAPGGGARMYSVTANLILHTPESHHAGFYVITGGGWYHRSWDLTAPSLSLGTICLPSYAFWGVACTNGIVASTTTLDSGSADGGGWNIGAGFTYRMKESHLKVYAETRYHVAYFSTLDTRTLPVTFGLRW